MSRRTWISALTVLACIRAPAAQDQRPAGGLRVTEVLVDYDAQTIEMIGENFDAMFGYLTVEFWHYSDISTSCRVDVSARPHRISCDFSSWGPPPDGVYKLTVYDSAHSSERPNSQCDVTVGAARPVASSCSPSERENQDAAGLSGRPGILARSYLEASVKQGRPRESGAATSPGEALLKVFLMEEPGRLCLAILLDDLPDLKGYKEWLASFDRDVPPDPIPPYLPCPCNYPAVIPADAWPRGAKVRVACTGVCSAAAAVSDDKLQPFLHVTKQFTFMKQEPRHSCDAAAPLRWLARPRNGLGLEEVGSCSYAVLDYLKALRDARPDLVFTGDDLDACRPMP